MNNKDFQSIQTFCTKFNSNKTTVEPMQLIDFLSKTKNLLYTFLRELKISAFSLSGKNSANHYTEDFNSQSFIDTAKSLNNLIITTDYCSENNHAIIEQLKDQCITAIKSIQQTFSYMQSKTSVRKTFYDHHQDYSYNSPIADNMFLEVYQMYLKNNCYDSSKQTFNCLRYFITGKQRPLLLESVLWIGEPYLLIDFLKDMECNQSSRQDWITHAGLIFTVKDKSNNIVFINPETLLQTISI